ncbi:unnamed protein product [Tuber melanosporum]|uniref:(Perigord truffle) hypothetical protein n=1 Tax=Tuber melanosporum (strain Mel28) TaxID=656061 RepID=D5GHU2_TUBMM|nr:uncharacterized protein GSTUM_00008113001 [Tuber melanosporum]CAZ84085.1 unnamed protein product [Tuber melanosporum]
MGGKEGENHWRTHQSRVYLRTWYHTLPHFLTLSCTIILCNCHIYPKYLSTLYTCTVQYFYTHINKQS